VVINFAVTVRLAIGVAFTSLKNFDGEARKDA
jgi:hypothetical protein